MFLRILFPHYDAHSPESFPLLAKFAGHFHIYAFSKRAVHTTTCCTVCWALTPHTGPTWDTYKACRFWPLFYFLIWTSPTLSFPSPTYWTALARFVRRQLSLPHSFEIEKDLEYPASYSLVEARNTAMFSECRKNSLVLTACMHYIIGDWSMNPFHKIFLFTRSWHFSAWTSRWWRFISPRLKNSSGRICLNFASISWTWLSSPKCICSIGYSPSFAR